MAPPRAVIFGCQTTHLLPAEASFFSCNNPLGFILFSRNCQSPEQIQELIYQLKTSVGRDDVFILIDQEGGRVQRLTPPHWRNYPAAAVFGQLADDDLRAASNCVSDNAWLIGQELHALGITVNCAPVVDLMHANTHPVIGDRAFSNTVEFVVALALHTIRGFQEAGIIPVIKHLPGHGRAVVDSHESLPVSTASREELYNSDFLVFRLLCQALATSKNTLTIPWGMTAHMIYADIDPDYPATQSSAIIEDIIRQYIEFEGFLISDCLTMKALSGSFEERVKRAFNAGCDAILHCSADLDEMIEVVASTPLLTEESITRLGHSRINPYTIKLHDVASKVQHLKTVLQDYEYGSLEEKGMKL